MRVGRFIIIIFGIVIVGYMFYLFVGMSSTYPPLKNYNFHVSKQAFDQKLADRILSSPGWSFERRDSIKTKESKDCFWVSLSYKQNDQYLEYIVKYCISSNDLKDDDKCLNLYVVSLVDYVKQKSYKTSSKDVDKLMQLLEGILLNGLAPHCSN